MEVNRSWEAQPKWMHLHYNSYIYGSGNTKEGLKDSKSQNTRKSVVEQSLLEHKQDQNNSKEILTWKEEILMESHL